MNTRRRYHSQLPQPTQANRRVYARPVGGAKGSRKRAKKAAGSAETFADFVVASMFLPPDLLSEI